jgi:hypothetical protein
MANWFDPASPAVRAVLTGVLLVSLLMAAALPGAFGAQGDLRHLQQQREGTS